MIEDKDQALASVKDWILARKKGSEEVPLDLDTDLIENRHIDSLMILDFLFFLEHLVGREMPMEPKLVSSLRTLRLIRDNII